MIKNSFRLWQNGMKNIPSLKMSYIAVLRDNIVQYTTISIMSWSSFIVFLVKTKPQNIPKIRTTRYSKIPTIVQTKTNAVAKIITFPQNIFSYFCPIFLLCSAMFYFEEDWLWKKAFEKTGNISVPMYRQYDSYNYFNCLQHYLLA